MTWSDDKYFAKAQRYWTKATSFERSSEDFFLNVSFYLEFFVRGCLVRKSPSLNSAADEESILYAAGLTPRKPVRSISIDLALERIARLVPNVTEQELKFASVLMSKRNGELHGDADEMGVGTEGDLLPNILSFIVKISVFSEQNLSIIMGADDANQANHIAQALAGDRKQRVGNLVRAHKDRFYHLSPVDQQKREMKLR